MIYCLARMVWLVLCWLELMAFTATLYVLSFVSAERTQPAYSMLFRLWCRLFVRALGVELRLHQKNRDPLPKHFILIANHPSAFEDIGVPALFDVVSLAKIEVLEWWIAGRINRAAGTLFVRRESRDSRQAAAERVVAQLQKGRNVAIYPEGGCKGKRIFSSFRYGAFDISLRTGIPILPVFLHYEAQDAFEWKPNQTLLQKLWHFLRAPNNRVNYYVHDAIDPARFMDKRSYCEHVHGLYLGWQAKYLD
ncbi:MAG: lysophospholipid acyltransferase family protein [Acidiferrobacterales bacterium]